nr:hypothetical protein [Tanacetum cinerariifolium]
ANLRYFNSLKIEVDSLRSQLETQKAQFLNEIDRLSKEYYYADHMNAILGVYTELDEDLKAQLQDKGIVISELKKLLKKLKGKSVDTKFEKSLVIRQPNAFESQRPLVLGKPTTFSNSFIRKDFSKSTSVTQSHMSNDFSKPVTAQTLPTNKKSILKNTNVLAPGMFSWHGLVFDYTSDTNFPNPICLMAKATSSQAWLWHRRLSHLNFDTINLLSKNDIVVGLPKLKFVKDHLCSSCELEKAKRKYKDETPEVLINFLRLVQRGLQAQVRVVRTDKGTEFLNQTLHAYFAAEGIIHQTSVARTPEQNGVVERRNRTLVEAARTLLSATKEKGDECIFMGYSTQSIAYRVFNKRTRMIMKSIHVNFDELPQMALDQISSDPAPECQSMALNHDSLSLANQRQANVPQADKTVTTSNKLDLLFSPMFDELLNGYSKVVSKTSAVSAVDAPNQRQQLTTPLNNHTTLESACQAPTLEPTVTFSENINQAETYAENDQVADDEFINIFSTPVQDQGETSSCHVDSSNMHIFYQRYPFEHRWTKDH